MDYEPEIVLETERLLFRPHTIADMDAFCDMEQDPDVRRYVGGKPRLREDAGRRFLGQSMKPVSDKLSMWATVYKAENVYIGRCGIYPHFNNDAKPIPGEASLGLYIAKKYWNMGFATEAAKAFIKLGFEELDIKRIVTMVQFGNDASVHVLEKLGFTVEYLEEGGPRSFYHFELKNQSQI